MGRRFSSTFRSSKGRRACADAASDENKAKAVVEAIIAALTSVNAKGVADAWTARVMEIADKSLDEKNRQSLDFLLTWRGYVYRTSHECIPELGSRRSVVYGLWRLGVNGKPITSLPHNIGETGKTAFERLKDSHINWWGDGKPIGVTVVSADRDVKARKSTEGLFQDIVLPFCNCDGHRLTLLRQRWCFPPQ